MPALSFSIPQLVPAILAGTKVNTFRIVRAGTPCRFDVGDPLFLYWKQRTRDCTKLAEARCVDLVPFLPKPPVRCSPDGFLVRPPRHEVGGSGTFCPALRGLPPCESPGFPGLSMENVEPALWSGSCMVGRGGATSIQGIR